MPAKTMPPPSGLGPIDPNTLYPLPELKARTGMGQTALRTARQSGLKILYTGSRAFCLGRDFIAWLESRAKTTR